MKRLFQLSIFISLLGLLNACVTDTPSAIPPDTGTAVAHTQTATMWTPLPTATPDPDEAKIVEWMNEGLLAADPLERTIDAQYQVMDASFPYGPTSAMIFRVDMRCECPSNAQCCVPERMFVIAMRAIRRHKDDIIGQVPGNATEVHLVCYNHKTPIGVMVARWADVKSYLQENINGFQLGSRVYKTGVP